MIRLSRISRAVCLTLERVAGRSRPQLMKQCQSLCLAQLYSSDSSHGAKQVLWTNFCLLCGINSAGIERKQRKNHRQKEELMSNLHSDALVFFGATGDLA